MTKEQVHKLTLAGLFAAMAFACFSYLRIEIPMGMGLTGKIYVGHAFIMVSALLLGAKYGALSGAVGLFLADVLAGYTTSAPPTFLAKFLLGTGHPFFLQILYPWRSLCRELCLCHQLRCQHGCQQRCFQSSCRSAL